MPLVERMLIPDVNQIGFQFCGFDSTVAQVVQWGTQGSVGHVDIILPSTHPQAGSLIGAQNLDGLGGKPSGVQIRPADYGATCGMLNRKRVLLPTTPECAASTYEWVCSLEGEPYDLKAIFGILFNSDWAQKGHLICSGFGTGALTQPTIPFINHKMAKDWRIFTPEELLLVCSAFAEVYDLDAKTRT